MDPKKTALVLIEYQNDFTSDGGTLHDAVKPVMDSTAMLPNTVETVAQARARGVMIVHAPITFTDDYHELTDSPVEDVVSVLHERSNVRLLVASRTRPSWARGPAAATADGPAPAATPADRPGRAGGARPCHSSRRWVYQRSSR